MVKNDLRRKRKEATICDSFGESIPKIIVKVKKNEKLIIDGEEFVELELKEIFYRTEVFKQRLPELKKIWGDRLEVLKRLNKDEWKVITY